jgi:hypothetical protein
MTAKTWLQKESSADLSISCAMYERKKEEESMLTLNLQV